MYEDQLGVDTDIAYGLIHANNGTLNKSNKYEVAQMNMFNNALQQAYTDDEPDIPITQEKMITEDAPMNNFGVMGAVGANQAVGNPSQILGPVESQIPR